MAPRLVVPCETTESGLPVAVTVSVCGTVATVSVTSALAVGGGDPSLVAVAVRTTVTACPEEFAAAV